MNRLALDVQLNSEAPEALRLAGVVLLRIATGGGAEADIARDLALLVGGKTTPDAWRVSLMRIVAALSAGGYVETIEGRLAVTDTGRDAAADTIGARKGLPATWIALRDGPLVAKALGFEAASASRQKSLAKIDGLRMAIVEAHWKLKLKGTPSASRIRAALALVALERAFGNQVKSGLGDKTQLPAKASRLLAAQLVKKPRDFGTDSRLIAALAADVSGVSRSNLGELRLAVLRQYLGNQNEPPQRKRRTPKTADAKTQPAPQSTLAGVPSPVMPPAAPVRPDPAGFAAAVQTAARSKAEGWAGNRKAFVSQVWTEIVDRHPQWGLTEIEFKCMLTEAHRTGLLALASADLKDKRSLSDVQASAIAYKNTVWHYVRVED